MRYRPMHMLVRRQ